MKNRLTLLVGILVVVVLLVYMFAFQVRYDEVAVVTTFEKAEPPRYTAEGVIARNAAGDPEEPGSLKAEPGLYARWPWPIQSVYTYTKRVQILDDTPEEQTTADGYSVILRTYLGWRIEDPHAFFVSVKTVEEAERRLQPLLREVRGILGRYRFDQLVNTDPARLALPAVEKEALELVQQRLREIRPSYGIAVEHLGIRRIVLPERVTENVFARMRTTRERMAAGARSTGASQASTIRNEAENAQRTILSFASRRADTIRAEGIRQSAEAFGAFKEDPSFAVFLAQLEGLKRMLAKNTTLVLDARGPLELFRNDASTQPAPTGTPVPSPTAKAR